MSDHEIRENPDNPGVDDRFESEIKEDFFSLLKVPVVKKHLRAQIEQAKELFREQIKDFFLKNPSKVIPFPNANSSEFKFELKRISCAGGGFKWKVFFDHDQHLPTEMILPYQLIDLLSAYPVDAENTSELSKIMINGYTYHVYFIKALSDYVVGIVQRIANKLRVAPDNFIVYDTTQYTDLPEKKRLAIFKWYLENNPVLREKILLEFFVNILPDSEELRKMI